MRKQKHTVVHLGTVMSSIYIWDGLFESFRYITKQTSEMRLNDESILGGFQK